MKPHFQINNRIYKLILMLYVLSVLGYVLCQRKTSQSIRTIKIFREKRDLYGLSTSFYRFLRKSKWKTCDEKKKAWRLYFGVFHEHCLKYNYDFLFSEVSIIRHGIRYFFPDKNPLPNPLSQESIKNPINPLLIQHRK